jgi:hypothetical protein
MDLAFVRERSWKLCAERGRPSIGPVIFFKLQLIMFFEGIRPERQLIAMPSLNLATRRPWQTPIAVTTCHTPPPYFAPLKCFTGGEGP